jgi:hypothetical protein
MRSHAPQPQTQITKAATADPHILFRGPPAEWFRDQVGSPLMMSRSCEFTVSSTVSSKLLYLRRYLRIFAVSSSPDRTASVSSTVSSSSDRTAPYLPPYLVPGGVTIRNGEKYGVGTSRRLSAGRCAGSRRRGYTRSSFFVCTTHGAHPLSRHVILARSGPL